MKTVAAPAILVFYKVQKPQYQQIKKKSKPLKGFFSSRTDVGRTGHHDDWLPQFWSFTKYKNHTKPITKKGK